MSTRIGGLKRFANVRVLLVLVLAVAYAGAAGYYLMSDMSVQGFTVKVFSAIRFCTIDPALSSQLVNYDVYASVWSTQSLRTTVTNLRFTLAADGNQVSNATAGDVSLNPGQGAPLSLSFKDSETDTGSLPRTSNLVLTVTASVGAGVITSTLTRSDSFTEDFGSTYC